MDALNTTSLKEKILDYFFKLTIERLIISFLAAIMIIAALTLYENRQYVFRQTSVVVVNKAILPTGDYSLVPPSPEGVIILDGYLAKNPEVLMLSVVDANQIENRRVTVHRAFSDLAVKTIVEKSTKSNPAIGSGPLFTTESENNIQILAVLNGEFYCTKPSNIGSYVPEEIRGMIVYECRTPLPPAFGKATGWITLHLKSWPPINYDYFKSEALIFSLEYYNKEVLKAKQ